MAKVQLPKTLLNNFAAGICIPWCGAGISIGSGMPAWIELARQFVEAVREHGISDEELHELEYLLECGMPEDVIDFCRTFLGEGEYRELLRRIFEGSQAPSAYHEKVVSLPVPAIFTTNYDRLVERAFARLKGDLPVVLTSSDPQSLWMRFARREQFVLKVHGDIARPETVVLSSRDYTRHVFGNIQFMEFIRRVFLSNSILFMGTSLSDIYIRRMLEEATYLTAGVGMPHYAFMHRSSAGPIRSRILRDCFNVNVIPFDDYQSMEEAVGDLANVALAASPAPNTVGRADG